MGQRQPLDRRIPTNPKYATVKSRLDTGSSLSKANERLEYLRSSESPNTKATKNKEIQWWCKEVYWFHGCRGMGGYRGSPIGQESHISVNDTRHQTSNTAKASCSSGLRPTPWPCCFWRWPIPCLMSILTSWTRLVRIFEHAFCSGAVSSTQWPTPLLHMFMQLETCFGSYLPRDNGGGRWQTRERSDARPGC